jgi:hypothetical protein
MGGDDKRLRSVQNEENMHDARDGIFGRLTVARSGGLPGTIFVRQKPYLGVK